MAAAPKAQNRARHAPGHRRAGWRAWTLVLLPLLAAGCAGDDGTTAGNSRGEDPAYVGGVDSSRLIGLASTQVTGLLGAADFRRDDGPAEILQYRSPTCVLDLFLYRDGGSGDYRVKYIEARDRSLAQLAPQACVASVVRSRNRPVSG